MNIILDAIPSVFSVRMVGQRAARHEFFSGQSNCALTEFMFIFALPSERLRGLAPADWPPAQS